MSKDVVKRERRIDTCPSSKNRFGLFDIARFPWHKERSISYASFPIEIYAAYFACRRYTPAASLRGCVFISITKGERQGHREKIVNFANFPVFARPSRKIVNFTNLVAEFNPGHKCHFRSR